jgi:hypothetical protein
LAVEQVGQFVLLQHVQRVLFLHLDFLLIWTLNDCYLFELGLGEVFGNLFRQTETKIVEVYKLLLLIIKLKYDW